MLVEDEPFDYWGPTEGGGLAVSSARSCAGKLVIGGRFAKLRQLLVHISATTAERFNRSAPT